MYGDRPKSHRKKVREEKSQKKSHRTESHRKKVKTGCVGRGGDRGGGQGVGGVAVQRVKENPGAGRGRNTNFVILHERRRVGRV